MLPSKLLVSLQSADELRLVEGLALSWIDLKNPSVGSLGCPNRIVAAEFLAMADRCLDRTRCQLSIALGELAEPTWSKVSEIAERFDFAKVALAGCAKREEWRKRAGSLAAEIGGGERLILVHYADHSRAISPDWKDTLGAAVELGCKYLLIDTYDKSAGRLWDWYIPGTIRELANAANAQGIELSIAGSLRLDELSWARTLGASVIGVRGAACQDGSRVLGLCRDRLRLLSEIFSNQAVTL